MRLPGSRFTLGNFARSLLYSSMATLKLGLDVLVQREGVELRELVGHGGLFKTPEPSQRMMAALGFPVSVLETAGEGGAWGIAVLADYMLEKHWFSSLDEFLQKNTSPVWPCPLWNLRLRMLRDLPRIWSGTLPACRWKGPPVTALWASFPVL